MMLYKQEHTKNFGSKPLFDKTPTIFWNDQTKEITLMVHDVRHEVKGNSSRYDYGVTLTVEELQGIIGALAKPNSK